MMNPRDVFIWDPHSDQPHVIRDRSLKRRLYVLGAAGSVKTLLTFAVALLPAWVLRHLRPDSALPAAVSDIGLGVSVESVVDGKTVVPMAELVAALEELGIQRVLLRVSLGEPDNFDASLALAESLAGRQLLVDVLQDRRHIEDPAALEARLRQVFSSFSPLTRRFKIGNAVNRRKWGFRSLDEYFRFFRTAQRLRDREFPELELAGGSIIDFELPNFARSVLHFHPIRYDAVAALLYVDRRGAPENRQLGSNLPGKLSWFTSLMRLSGKCTNRLLITETNWPLENTGPFAPAVGDCMVDEQRQAAYLARYYLLAFSCGRVEAVYWHQLVAPGYGLIDNRGAEIRRRRAFFALRTLVGFFAGARITDFELRDGIYRLTAESPGQRVAAVWTNDEERLVDCASLPLFAMTRAEAAPSVQPAVYDLTGERRAIDPADINGGAPATLSVGGDVTYLVLKPES